MMSATDMQRLSHVEVVNSDLFQMPARTPLEQGPLDKKMGVSDKSARCGTCGLTNKDCTGHFGHITLALPVYHVGYFKAIISILHKVCKRCSRLLLEEADIDMFRKRYQGTSIEALKRRELDKAVLDKCRRSVVCPHCSAINGPVKKVGALKLIHERYRTKHVAMDQLRADFDTASQAIKELPSLLASNRVQEDLTPSVVRAIFSRIRPDEVVVLSLAEGASPESMILTSIMVPPVCIRPSIPAVDGSNTSNEDDLTMTIREIAHMNAELQKKIALGSNNEMIMENWEHLQLKCALYINGELSGVMAGQNSKPLRGLAQRLKGKSGRFRGNLSGKRVDFSSRTVISPDPNLEIDQVAVPIDVCKILTFPERVTQHNRSQMQQLIRNGPDKYPGANYLVKESNEMQDGPMTGNSASTDKVFLQYGDRKKLAKNLKVGSIVERHLIDGDIVLFNRQPSLHKMSIMSHRVKALPWRTFRFNECVCAPYNADFDGDEMNLHVPQTEEARAEAYELMGVKSNICTPRNGEPLISAIQDFITGAYLLTQKDNFLSKSQFAQLATYMLDGASDVRLPPPAIIKPVNLWTGKQLITLMLQSNQCARGMRVTLEKKTKASYKPSKAYGQVLSLCPEDGYVILRNSTLVCGTLDKVTTGGGSKSTIFYLILRDYGKDAAVETMRRLAKLCCFYLQTRGFSIGIGDVTPSAALTQKKRDLVINGYGTCQELIEKMDAGALEPLPGSTVAGTLEASVTEVLSDIRKNAGIACKEELPRFNAPVVMARCGSKGGDLNISQMIACVGQQTIGGNRMPAGFEDRTLPHFNRHSADPNAKGFVSNSFYTGLTPSEFFFHTMCGREGLVDTAVKTAETGYMSRRLMKALEDLSTDYDLRVQNSSGTMIQFCYGDDGLDPAGMEGDGTSGGSIAPVNLEHLWTHVVESDRTDKGPRLLPYEIRAITDSVIRDGTFREIYASPAAKLLIKPGDDADAAIENHFFIQSVRQFIEVKSTRLAALRRKYGCSSYDNAPPEGTQSDHVSETGDGEIAVKQLFRVTAAQLRTFLERCAFKYSRASVEAGTAVGAVGAQSIGEPGTQMTLKTFHFAGIAAMNITQGVPRIKEIINASKNISTPVITAPVEDSGTMAAQLAKARVDRCLLGDIADYVTEIYSADRVCVRVKIDPEHITKLNLKLGIQEVADAVLASALKLKPAMLTIVNRDTLEIVPPPSTKSTTFFALQHLRDALPKVMIKGDKDIKRVIIQAGKDGDAAKVLVEGTDMQAVMGARGIQGTAVTSNHIIDVERCLGIEAARNSIINEIQSTMSAHGMTIDSRHVMLLADLMTFKGEILGITRFGIAKMKSSTFMLASFEKTTDHLFDAALQGSSDPIDGVSECIILGKPMKIGTGLFDLVQAKSSSDGSSTAGASTGLLPPKKLLFESHV